MHVTHTLARVTMLAAIAGLAAVPAARAQNSIHKLVATGETVVGGPVPVVTCGPAFIDQYGQTALVLHGPNGDARHVARGLNLLASLVEVGGPAPALPGVTVANMGLVRQSTDGDLAVTYRTSSNTWTVAVGDPFSWRVGYREGLQVPGQPAGTSFSGLPGLTLSGPDGQFAFSGPQGVYYIDTQPAGGPAQSVISVGDFPNLFVQINEVHGLAMNDHGQVLAAFVAQDTFNGTTMRGLAVGTPAGFTPIVTSSTTAAGGGTFDPSAPVRGSINNAGQVVFSWKTIVPNPAFDTGIWVYTPGQGLTQIMRKGHQVPGHPGLVYGDPQGYTGNFSYAMSAVIGGGGHVCFVARLQGSGVHAGNDTALFAGRPGAIEMIAREGDLSGINEPAFGDFFESDVNYWINEHGDVAFMANRVDTGEGVWRRTSNGLHFSRIAATGRTLPVNGESRTVFRMIEPGICSGLEDGRSAPFNNAGQLAFSVQFNDNTYATYRFSGPTGCYANCDGSTTPPVLNVNDFICFQSLFAAGNPRANCDGSTVQPYLNVNDFVCFQTRFAAGCP